MANYANFSDADLILVTHEHGDHFNVETLTGLIEENTKLIVNPAIFEPMPESLRAISTAMADGDILEMMEIGGAATPAYNLTENRMKYHPQGRDNGYLLTVDGMRIYIAGDTEDTPEMRAMTDIAFVPMILPYTMDETAAASAVSEFAPGYVYRYHCLGSDLDVFTAALICQSEVKLGNWYA